MSVRYLGILFILLIWLFTSSVFANTIEMDLSNDHLTLDDTFTLTYIVTDKVYRSHPDFSVLQKDFKILNTSYGNSIRTMNGVTSVQTFWRLELQPKKTGELSVPAIDFGPGKSNAARVMVSEGKPPFSPSLDRHGFNSDKPFFIDAKIDPSNPYVQSQLIYTFKLYFRVALNQPRIELPSLKDITFVQLGDKPVSQTMIAGVPYNIVEKRFAMFANKAGDFEVPPMHLEASVEEPADYDDGPFYFNAERPIHLATKSFNISVRDVPDTFQGDTWLPAKDVTLSDSWSHQGRLWEVGVPVTRTLKLRARGLRSDQLPDFNIEKMDDMNVYVERAKRSDVIDGNDVQGILEQKITYIPNVARDFVLPAMKVDWWNTDKDMKGQARLDAMNIAVEKGVATANNLPANNTPKAQITISKPVVPQKSSKSIFYQVLWILIASAIVMTIALWIFCNKTQRKTMRKKQNQRHSVGEKEFLKACRTNDPLKAQHYLLSWAKKHIPDRHHTLTTIAERLNDQESVAAIHALEEAIYSGKTQWSGEELRMAFVKMKKSSLSKTITPSQKDPLPPLYP